MKRVVLQIQPFDLLQNLGIFDDMQQIGLIQISISEIPEKLCQLSKEYGVEEVEIYGPSQYTKNIEKQTKKQEIEKYQNNILTFKYI